MAGLGESLKKSILGSKQDELITSGTLVVTRGIGVIAVALIGIFVLFEELGDVGPWKEMSGPQKLAFVLGAAAVWAVVAAADALARGIATSKQAELVVTLPEGLKATRTEGPDSAGWSVVAAKFGPAADPKLVEYLVVKAGEAADWVAPADLELKS